MDVVGRGPLLVPSKGMLEASIRPESREREGGADFGRIGLNIGGFEGASIAAPMDCAKELTASEPL